MMANLASAGEWDITGFVGMDSQAFWQDSRFDTQSDGINASLFVQPELYWQSDDGRQRVSLVGFGRIDGHDDERTHADLREAYWGFEGDGYDLNVGINKVFWGVTESRHLVDVINQTDLVEDIDQEDKLGQPMLNLNLDRDFGRFELFVLPGFRERTFPGPDGRFRTPLPVDTDQPIYTSSEGDEHIDLALRYSHYFGNFDVGVYLFDGTSREPGFIAAPEGDRLLPIYEPMTQVGLELQFTRDAWLWKFEGIHRDASSDAFFAAVGGFEYSVYGIAGSDADLGLLLEYLYDGRDSSADASAPPTVFDNDLFVGTRLALNDASDTSVLAGATVDLDSGEMFINVEAERRFGDRLSAELRLRAFLDAKPGDVLYFLEQDDYLQLRLSWYY